SELDMPCAAQSSWPSSCSERAAPLNARTERRCASARSTGNAPSRSGFGRAITSRFGSGEAAPADANPQPGNRAAASDTIAAMTIESRGRAAGNPVARAIAGSAWKSRAFGRIDGSSSPTTISGPDGVVPPGLVPASGAATNPANIAAGASVTRHQRVIDTRRQCAARPKAGHPACVDLPGHTDSPPGADPGAGEHAMEAGGVVNYILLGIVWLIFLLHKA